MSTIVQHNSRDAPTIVNEAESVESEIDRDDQIEPQMDDQIENVDQANDPQDDNDRIEARDEVGD